MAGQVKKNMMKPKQILGEFPVEWALRKQIWDYLCKSYTRQELEIKCANFTLGNLSYLLHNFLQNKKTMWRLLLLSSYTVSSSLWPHGLQHTRLPCPSLSSGIWSRGQNTVEFILKEKRLILFKYRENSLGLPWWLSGKKKKKSACPCRKFGFNPWVWKIPWRRKWQPPPVFLPGKSHGQRTLVGYSPQGHKRVGHVLSTMKLR